MTHEVQCSYDFPKDQLPVIKMKMLNWLRPFSIFIYLDNNNYKHEPNRFEAFAAYSLQPASPIPAAAQKKWHFGHIGYDYKNTIDPKLETHHQQQLGFNNLAFYEADAVVYIPYGSSKLCIHSPSGNAGQILQQVLDSGTEYDSLTAEPQWEYSFAKEAYLQAVENVRQHIIEGDCYELNLCAEAVAYNMELDPWALFHRLNTANPSPFAAFYRNAENFLAGSSPERFLWKEQQTVLSQPIKGTIARGINAEADERQKALLLHDEKERAENVMIVDLVRNDLAKSCIPGSIAVPELFGIYTLPTVHQMISTVTGQLRNEVGSCSEIIHNTFPMGSMTGAPKQIVMQLIDQYERSARGIYSGTVGYITPEGDFDFSVNIRSLVWNQASQRLSYHTGGAITYDSVPEKEWEELRLKARAMERLFLK